MNWLNHATRAGGRGLHPEPFLVTFAGMFIQKLLAVAVPLALAGTPALAAGQGPSPAAKPDSWSAVVDLAFSGASGTDQTVLLTTGFKVAHLRTERFEMELSGSVRYGRSEGREVARNLKSGFKLDVLPAAQWSPFISITGERDPFRKLDMRSNSGAGIKYSFWRAPQGEASLSAAVLHSYENFVYSAEDPLPTRHSARWSWRFKGNRMLGERVRIENTSLYQPVWDHSSEYLLDMNTSIRVPMTTRIAVGLTHSFERDSRPPEGVRKDDHLVKAGLTIETRW
jgi:putative salt-induced outer membrane protein YdiY